MEANTLSFVLIPTLALITILYIKRKNRKQKRAPCPPNEVMLYQIGRGPYAPSPIPFVMKLETYLRMARIPYKTDHSMIFGPKGKFPWIEYNGEIVADSEFCIEFLNKKFDIDLNQKLTEKQKAVGHAFQMMFEQNTYWTFVMDRMVYSDAKDFHDVWKVPNLSIIRNLLKRSALKSAKAQGMGRHSKEEVYTITRKDLTAFSNYLGDKNFMFGSEACLYDCCMFGLLSQLYFQPFGGYQGEIVQEYPNLCGYCERMKKNFWPDWEDCITHGNTRSALK